MFQSEQTNQQFPSSTQSLSQPTHTMRHTLLLLAATANLATAAITTRDTLARISKGPEIWPTFNEIDECEMNQAIECLHDQICARRKVPFHGKIRCTIGSSVVYLCNYKSQHGKDAPKGEEPGQLACDQEEMYEAWRQIRIAKGSQTGWWYDARGKRTYGFDRSCREGECDNGWKQGSEGEQCSNIDKKEIDWTFDFVSDIYPNYTAKYIQPLPQLNDESEPMYFNPWQEGKRPQ